jgi:peroxiredoxin
VLQAVLALALLAPLASAQMPEPKAPPPSPPASTGLVPILTPHPGMIILGQISVGQPAPDFELDGSRGAPVRLSTLRGNWVLLVFTDRKEGMALLGGVDHTLRQHGIQLVGVCNEKAHTLETFAAREGLPYLLLADVTGEVSAVYGLWDRISTSTVPGFALIDRHGVVQIALLGRTLPAQEMARMVIDATGSS